MIYKEISMEFVINKYSHLLKKCNERFFIYNNGIWTEDRTIIDNKLTNLISSMNIKYSTSNGLSNYSYKKSHIEACKSLIKANESYRNDNFITELFNSNLYHIAFEDGIYSFKDNKLLPNSVENIYFTKKIYRNFPQYDNRYNFDGTEITLKEAIDLVYKKIIIPILPEKHQRDYFLYCLSRSIAGHYEDKKWFLGQGLRDSGKGVLSLLLKLAFQSYVGVIKSENFICSRISGGDVAKKLSWLIPLEFCRIAISNEISAPKNSKIDGEQIKSFASGGDLQCARQNYKDEREFQLQTTLWIMCNEFPAIEPEDTYQNLEAFFFKSKFVSNNKLIDGCPDFYQLEDKDIKNFCKYEFVIDAFTMIILENYDSKIIKPHPSVFKDMDEYKCENYICLETLIPKYFEHVNDPEAKIKNSDMLEYINTKCNINIKSTKLTQILNLNKIGKSCRFYINGALFRGFSNIKYSDIDHNSDFLSEADTLL